MDTRLDISIISDYFGTKVFWNKFQIVGEILLVKSVLRKNRFPKSDLTPVDPAGDHRYQDATKTC